MLSRFHLIPERHGQKTDGLTDGRTDTFAISISRVSMLTRDKNDIIVYMQNLFIAVHSGTGKADWMMITHYQ